MHRIRVESTNIESIGFAFHVSHKTLNTISRNAVSVGDIEVEFKNGTIGIYRDVPYSIYRAVVDADSIGSALYRLVKHAYEWTQLVEKGIPSCK